MQAARDALLDHLERGDARRALRLLLAELSRRRQGRGAAVLAFDAQGSEAWHEGTLPLLLPTVLPIMRLGRPLGELHLAGPGDAATLGRELAPVLPALAGLLHAAARQAEPALYAGPDAELIRAALAGAGTFVWEWWIESDWLTDIDQGLVMLGYDGSRGGLAQDDWNALIHPEDLASNEEAFQRHARGESDSYEHAYRARAADGRWRWMLERGRIVERGADGRPLRMIGTQADITEQRELASAREEAVQARAASQAKTAFLARMSHELRTPLNAVLGFTQLMQLDRAEPPQPEQRRRLRLVREAGEHLLHMINDLLDLTQIESGGLALAPEPLAPREAVEQVFAMLSAQAQQQGVSLVLAEEPPGSPLLIETDRTRLRQVLLNLLSNAIKYNRRGGLVEVSIGPDRDEACLRVRDTGLGIAPDHLARLFEPFERGAQATSGIEGSGIGLALTQALVQRLGGRLEVASRPGEGSTFSVWLPAAASR